jgi:hypothetical protein
MKYQYVGTDQGVPGLPHEISDEQAEALGVADLLAEAVKNGSYATTLAPSPALPPVEEHNTGKGEKKNKKEINNG